MVDVAEVELHPSVEGQVVPAADLPKASDPRPHAHPAPLQRRVQELEAENAQLRSTIAQLRRENEILRRDNRARGTGVKSLLWGYTILIPRRVCGLLRMGRRQA